MKRILANLLIISVFFSVLYGCKHEYAIPIFNQLDGFTKLKEGFVIGASAKVEIWGRKNFYVGNNNLVVILYDSLNPTKQITDAHIYFLPVMHIRQGDSVRQLASPVENPGELPLNGVFPGTIAFVLPSGIDSTWKLGVFVHNHLIDKGGKAELDITVDNPSTPVLAFFKPQSPDTSTSILTIDQPSTPEVGLNDIGFTIYRIVDNTDFSPDDSYTISISSELPGSGAQSTGNVDPVNIGNGHYSGKVDFTASGEWKVNVQLKRNGITVSKTLSFNIKV